MTHPPITVPLPSARTRARGSTVVVPAPAAAPGPGGASLVHLFPPGPTWGHRFPVGPGGLVVGRGPGADVQTPDATASTRHARVEPAPGGGFRVADLGSTNGTFVNGVRVTRAALSDGDEVRAGASVYRLLAGPDPDAQFRAERARLAALDPVTGLPRGPELLLGLAALVSRGAAEGWPVALVLVELGRGRPLADRLGPAGADAAVREAGVRARGLARAADLVGRIGPTELGVALPFVGEGAAGRAADRFRAAVGDWPFDVGGRSVRVPVAVGAAVARHGDVADPAGLLDRAADRLAADPGR